VYHLKDQAKWSFLTYLTIPFFYLLKISVISSIIYVGYYLIKNKRLNYFIIIDAVTKADMVLIIPILIRIIWFSFYSDYSLEDIQYFFPGSALSIFDPNQVQKWLLFPLQALNIFELGFSMLLAWQLKEYFEGDFTASFKNVALSYGSSYVVWVLFVMFLTLNYT
jgi:hypothetical protein